MVKKKTPFFVPVLQYSNTPVLHCITLLMSKSYLRNLWLLSLIGLLLAGCNASEPSKPFDPHIAGLELVEWISGDPAMKAINKLHGMPIDVVTGFIAHYKGPREKATIWVSEAATKELAEEQIVIMIQKMKDNTRSPFSGYRDLYVRGLKVIAFDGMRQTHYVFRDNKWVYWISADAKRIDNILQHVYGDG